MSVPRPPPHRLVVVGGGAAGIFGAIQSCAAAADGGAQLEAVVFEQGPRPLSKVKISGGGRCNVLHDDAKPPAVLVENYPRGSRELLGPFTATFGAAEASAWFRERGVQLKTERDGRMFPTTDDSDTIVQCLLSAAAELGVEVVTRAKVLSIRQQEDDDDDNGERENRQEQEQEQLAATKKGAGSDIAIGAGSEGGQGGRRRRRFALEVQRSSGGKGKVSVEEADAVLLSPGSSPEAWRWMKALGHRVAEPVPSLFTLNLAEAGKKPAYSSSSSSAAAAVVEAAAKKSKSKSKNKNKNAQPAAVGGDKEGGTEWLVGLAGLSVPHALVSLLEATPKTAATAPAKSASDNGKNNNNNDDDNEEEEEASVSSASSPTTAAAEEEANEGGKQTAAAAAAASTTTTKKKKKKKKKKAKPLVTTAGPLLVTHTGLSGPAALKMSAFAARTLHDAEYRATVSVNWSGGGGGGDGGGGGGGRRGKGGSVGAISGGSSSLSASGDGFATAAEALAALLEVRDHRKDLANKAIATFCPFARGGAGAVGESPAEVAPPPPPPPQQQQQQQQQLLPRRLWNALVVEAAGIPEGQRWAGASGADLERLAAALTACRLTVTGKGAFKDEFVTCGGVALSDVALKRMESRRIPGLHFAGEVLDIDGVTGGFNFQSCWTTGFISGQAIGADVVAAAAAAAATATMAATRGDQ